jgi:hypothetical protein
LGADVGVAVGVDSIRGVGVAVVTCAAWDVGIAEGIEGDPAVDDDRAMTVCCSVASIVADVPVVLGKQSVKHVTAIARMHNRPLSETDGHAFWSLCHLGNCLILTMPTTSSWKD